MKVIYKYPLRVTQTQELQLPYGAEVLCCQTQGDEPCLWALVDADAEPAVKRTFRIYGKGHEIQEEGHLRYVGTFQQLEGALVWHVFEV